MPDTSTNVFAGIQSQAFKALVSKGIYAMLFPLKEGTDGKITVDTTINLLNGYPVGGFTGSGDTVDQEEYQDQLAGGSYKTFLGGAVDGGDLSFNTYFAPNKGKPQIAGVRNSTVFTPQFVLALAHATDTANLQGFFASGVNFSGGNDLKGDYGKVVGSSLKFKITGEPKWGYEAVGTLPKTLYGDTTVIETAYQKLYKQTTSEMPDDALLNA